MNSLSVCSSLLVTSGCIPAVKKMATENTLVQCYEATQLHRAFRKQVFCQISTTPVSDVMSGAATGAAFPVTKGSLCPSTSKRGFSRQGAPSQSCWFRRTEACAQLHVTGKSSETGIRSWRPFLSLQRVTKGGSHPEISPVTRCFFIYPECANVCNPSESRATVSQVFWKCGSAANSGSFPSAACTLARLTFTF